MVIELQGNKSLHIRVAIFFLQMASHVEECRPVYYGDREKDTRTMWWMSSDSVTQIRKQPCGFHCRMQHCANTHTNTHTAAASVCWQKESAEVAVQDDKAACAFKFHDPLFTAGAGWVAGRECVCTLPWIIGTARWMWGEWLKTGAPPAPLACLSACLTVSWLHTSKFHGSDVLKSTLVKLFVWQTNKVM